MMKRWWAWLRCRPSFPHWQFQMPPVETGKKTDLPDCTRTSCSWRWRDHRQRRWGWWDGSVMLLRMKGGVLNVKMENFHWLAVKIVCRMTWQENWKGWAETGRYLWLMDCGVQNLIKLRTIVLNWKSTTSTSSGEYLGNHFQPQLHGWFSLDIQRLCRCVHDSCIHYLDTADNNFSNRRLDILFKDRIYRV